jgi:hypothetical protein
MSVAASLTMSTENRAFRARVGSGDAHGVGGMLVMTAARGGRRRMLTVGVAAWPRA